MMKDRFMRKWNTRCRVMPLFFLMYFSTEPLNLIAQSPSPMVFSVGRPSLVMSAQRNWRELRLKERSVPDKNSVESKLFSGDIKQFLIAAQNLENSLDDADDGKIKKALRQFENLKSSYSDSDFEDEILLLKATLRARARNKLGDYSGALVLLKSTLQDSAPENSFYLESRVYEAFTAAVNSNLMLDAAEIYRKFPQFFQRDFIAPNIQLGMLNLADWAWQFGEQPLARDLWRRSAKNYPYDSFSRSAVLTFQKKSCEAQESDEFWGRLESRRQFSQDLLRRLGPLPGVKDFALTLADISENSMKQTLNANDLTFVERAKLLESAEFLMSVREYELAMKFLQYLQKSNSFDSKFPQDKFMFLYARALNSTQRPLEAAGAYQKIFKSFPKSSWAPIARQRYLLSLHYAQQFKEVVRETEENMKATKKASKISRWRTFWARYLSRENSNLKNSAAQSMLGAEDSNAKSRIEYWTARMQKGQESRNLLQKISKNAAGSYYGIMARLRASLDEPRISGDEDIRLSAKPLLTKLVPNTLPEWSGELISESPVNALLQFARSPFLSFSRDLIQISAREIKGSQRLTTLSRLSLEALDYRNSSSYARNAGGNIWGQSLSEDDLKSSIADNSMLWQLHYPLAYQPLVEAVAQEVGIEPALIYSIMRAESHYDSRAVSNVGARGLLQIMPLTGFKISSIMGDLDFEPSQLSSPDINIAYGAWYLKRLITYYQGNTVLAIAAYNAGPEAVDRWMTQTPKFAIDEFVENIPFDQTRGYVSKVLVFMDLYFRIYTPAKNGIDLQRVGGVSAGFLPKPVAGMEMF